ncbi:hypothetical protein ADK55_21105 [Streptomyces sp. WM4235]|uniref:hypothetical protein n=1 Tax=Streptomyces sp. WM4235 TaxID=1415551 RepID=UPI0006B01CC1|nr:hypothetical protein [Streptomyces sp. WM4235]KOU45952.1 hypothetical protein ADK55_21105 [Streptomyces sp. WM4235]
MGIQERERKMYRPLRRAGLEVIPNAVPEGMMPFVAGYGAEDFVGGFSHRYDTPRLVERLNEDWYRLALSSGLFDDRREFLVQIPQGVLTHRAANHTLHWGPRVPPAVWTRVRLLDRWDIMGRGAESAFLGIHAGHPGFAMMALDSSVFVSASTGEMGVDVVAVTRPDRSENILQFLEGFVGRNDTDPDRELQKLITVWLAGRGERLKHVAQWQNDIVRLESR